MSAPAASSPKKTPGKKAPPKKSSTPRQQTPRNVEQEGDSRAENSQQTAGGRGDENKKAPPAPAKKAPPKKSSTPREQRTPNNAEKEGTYQEEMTKGEDGRPAQSAPEDANSKQQQQDKKGQEKEEDHHRHEEEEGEKKKKRDAEEDQDLRNKEVEEDRRREGKRREDRERENTRQGEEQKRKEDDDRRRDEERSSNESKPRADDEKKKEEQQKTTTTTSDDRQKEQDRRAEEDRRRKEEDDRRAEEDRRRAEEDGQEGESSCVEPKEEETKATTNSSGGTSQSEPRGLAPTKKQRTIPNCPFPSGVDLVSFHFELTGTSFPTLSVKGEKRAFHEYLQQEIWDHLHLMQPNLDNVWVDSCIAPNPSQRIEVHGAALLPQKHLVDKARRAMLEYLRSINALRGSISMYCGVHTVSASAVFLDQATVNINGRYVNDPDYKQRGDVYVDPQPTHEGHNRTAYTGNYLDRNLQAPNKNEFRPPAPSAATLPLERPQGGFTPDHLLLGNFSEPGRREVQLPLYNQDHRRSLSNMNDGIVYIRRDPYERRSPDRQRSPRGQSSSRHRHNSSNIISNAGTSQRRSSPSPRQSHSTSRY